MRQTYEHRFKEAVGEELIVSKPRFSEEMERAIRRR
jgi:hypothetical protein